ncbi:MAG: hypothetical protein N3C61_03290, partial [Candidatus Micrarchaeota archaeon]|nr:hypothetical protein [Candidatus Micrarchaeota archaeon]
DYLGFRELERDAEGYRVDLGQYINMFIKPEPEGIREFFIRLLSLIDGPALMYFVDIANNKIRTNEYLRPKIKTKKDVYDIYQLLNPRLFIDTIILMFGFIVILAIFDLNIAIPLIGLFGIGFILISRRDERIFLAIFYVGHLISLLISLHIYNYFSDLYFYYLLTILAGLYTLITIFYLLSGFTASKPTHEILENNLYLEIIQYRNYLKDIATSISTREELDYAIVLDIPQNKIRSMISNNQELLRIYDYYDTFKTIYCSYIIAKTYYKKI